MRRILAACVFLPAALTAGGENRTVRPELIMQMGHTGELRTAKISPDQKFVLTVATADRLAILWNADTAREVRRFLTDGELMAAAFSPDSRSVLLAGGKDVCLWDILSGARQRCFAGHTDTVFSANFSKDGARLATSSRDGTARVWDSSTGRELRKLPMSDGFEPYSVAFTPAGELLMTDGDATIVNVGTGQVTKKVALPGIRMEQGIVSPDGRFLFVSGKGKDPEHSSHLIAIGSGKEILKIANPTFLTRIGVSPDGRFLITGGYDSPARIWDASTGQLLRRLKDRADGLQSVDFSADGRRVLTANSDRTASLWDVGTGTLLRRFEPNLAPLRSVAISRDGRYFAMGGDDRIARVWDTRTGEEVRRFEVRTLSVSSLEFSPDSRLLLAGESDSHHYAAGSAYLWDIATGKLVYRLDDHKSGVFSVAFSPDGRFFATADGVEGKIYLWDTKTGQRIKTLGPMGSSSENWVNSVAFSPDGTQLLTADGDNCFRLWNVATGQAIRSVSPTSFSGHNMESAVYSPSGKWILTGGFDSVLRVWDASTLKLIRRIEGAQDPIESVRFSPDGKIAVSAGDDNVHVWDVENSREIRKLEAHDFEFEHGFNSVAISPNGKFVIAVANDGVARIWSLSTGAEICRLTSLTDGTWAVASPDGFFDGNYRDHSSRFYWREANDSSRVVPVDAHAREYFRNGLLTNLWFSR